MAKAVIVIVECDEALLASQILLFEAQGHQVFAARTRKLAEQLLNSHCPDAIVLGHSLGREDREVLVAKARLIRPEARILVLHASGADLPVGSPCCNRFERRPNIGFSRPTGTS